MRWLGFLVLASWAVPAAAQTPVGTAIAGSGPNALQITLTTPNDIDCNNPGPACKPLNKAACETGAANDAEVVVTLPANQVPLTATSFNLYIWVQKQVLFTTVSGAQIPNCQLPTTPDATSQFVITPSPFSFASTTGPLVATEFDFPAYIQQNGQQTFHLFASDFMRGSGVLKDSFIKDACAEGVQQQYLLCFGVDHTGQLTAVPDNQVQQSQNERTAWVEFDVDTIPPVDVTGATAEGKETSLQVKPTAASDTQAGDQWFYAVRAIANEGAATGSDCRKWTDASKSGYVDATQYGHSFGIEGLTTNQWYEGCVGLSDAAANPSAAFASFTAKTIDQCDFAQCYPGDIKTGFCANVGPTPLAAALSLLLLRRRRARQEHA